MTLVRIGLVAMLVAGMSPSVASAQTTGGASRPPRPDQQGFLTTPVFAALVLGQQVRIITTDGQRHQGVVTALAADAMSVGRGQGTVVRFDRVGRVELNPRRIRRGTLLGLLIGGGVQAIFVWGALGADEITPVLATLGLGGAGIGAGIGAGMGAFLNAANRDADVIFDARRRGTTARLAPIVAPTRAGLALTVSWR